MTSTYDKDSVEFADGSADFARSADPHRRELLALCYRMLGSIDEAEDAVQETYLRAWSAYGKFEGRASMRTWLYRIATRVCLRALERGSRRPLPSGLAGPSESPNGRLEAEPSVAWLQPFPESMYAADPAHVVESREGMRLALIAALQYLPARQRAVLILRDVLAWDTDEVADMLGATRAAVNSVLQRARAQLASVSPALDQLTEPTDPRRRALLDGYTAAFENADVSALTEVLTTEAILEMPPVPTWFAGRDAVCGFLATRLHTAGHLRLRPTAANGQPAFGVYTRGSDGAHHLHAVHVLTVSASGITHVVGFQDPQVFNRFDLPPSVHDTL